MFELLVTSKHAVDTNDNYTVYKHDKCIVSIGRVGQVLFLSVYFTSKHRGRTLIMTPDNIYPDNYVRELGLGIEYHATIDSCEIERFKKEFARVWHHIRSNPWEMEAENLLPKIHESA